jgi:hypothetical protein
VLLTNQSSGQVSMFRSDWGSYPEASGGVNLEFVVTNLPSRPIAVAALPTPAVAQVRRFSAPFERAQTFPPGFLLTFRNSPEIDLIRYFNDVFSNPIRPYATRPNAVPITVNSSGGDSRGLAIDGTARRAAENACLEAAGQSPDFLGRVVCLAPKGADLANCTEKISECLVKRTSADEFEPLATEEESSLSACLNAAAPTPLEANESLPGRDFARATSSFTDLAGSEFVTHRMSGALAASDTGAKLFTEWYGSLG